MSNINISHPMLNNVYTQQVDIRICFLKIGANFFFQYHVGKNQKLIFYNSVNIFVVRYTKEIIP